MPSSTLGHRRGSSSSSEYSNDSDYSHSTAPTSYSYGPSLHQEQRNTHQYTEDVKWNHPIYGNSEARLSVCSVGTYASTVASEQDFIDDYQYEEPESYESELIESTAFPSTPSEFAEYFPSTRRMCIRHDDTADGNMNLRVDTEKQTPSGDRVDLTLFHLRMHDLKTRDFSLRRYCRESGREVCHSSRKYTTPASERRPGLQRSMSNALASLRAKPDSKMSPNNSFKSLKRSDSGYESMSGSEEELDVQRSVMMLAPKSNSIPLPTNTTKLEFSNYAHVDLKRRGTKSSKRYEFEYWGTSYAWRRVAKKTGKSKHVSYHLYNTETGMPVAHIVPTPMTPSEARAEESRGGFVPPSSMWISDSRLLSRSTDVADVIVATGLTALVDDCIKSRWHHKDRFHIPISMPSFPSHKMNIEYVGPKRLIDEVFNRRGNTATRYPTPLRQLSADA